MKSTSLHIADTLSRAHLDSVEGNQDDRARIMNIYAFAEIPDKRLDEIREATLPDTSLQTVIKLVLDGWPQDKHNINIPSQALPYFDMRDSLSIVDDILVKGEAIVIPSELRASIKKRFHSAHLGCESMKRRARGIIFWPGIAHDIKQLADSCKTFQEMKPRNTQEPLKQHNEGDGPCQKIGLDFFEIAGKHYLIVVDYYSNFIEIDLLTSQTSTRTITVLKKHFARYGIPRVIVSDGGPQFTCQQFNSFMTSWSISHHTSSPMHQRANGKAESAVKIMKSLLIKTYKDGGDPYEAILEQRNTPCQGTALSPAEMMFNHKTRSFLPSLSSKPKNTLVKGKRDARKRSVKTYHDRKSRKLSVIEIGQSVFYQQTEGQNWKWGKVTGILAPNTYQVEGANGGKYRRNRVHLRPTKVVRTPRDVSPIVLSRTPDQVLTSAVPSVPKTPTTGAEAKESHSHSEATTPIKSAGPERPKRESRLPIRFKHYVLNK